jgi:hypothetical protein
MVTAMDDQSTTRDSTQPEQADPSSQRSQSAQDPRNPSANTETIDDAARFQRMTTPERTAALTQAEAQAAKKDELDRFIRLSRYNRGEIDSPNVQTTTHAHKRTASPHPNEPPSKRFNKVAKGSDFDGSGGIARLESWLQELIPRFDYAGITSDSDKIALAALSLKKDVLTTYLRHKNETKTWDQFVTTIRDSIRDPGTVLAEQTFRYQRISQGWGKSNGPQGKWTARQLLTEIEAARARIPQSVRDDVKKMEAWHFINALDGNLRSKVLDHIQQEVRDVEQVITIAQREENKLEIEEKHKSRGHSRSNSVTLTGSDKSSKTTSSFQKPSSITNQELPSDSKKHCDHCGKPGHLEGECWTKYPEKRPKHPKR